MKLLNKLTICAVLFFSTSSVFAQQFINTKVDVIEGSGVYYYNEVVYLPANFSTAKKYPLVVFLHGMGEAGTDVNRLYNTGLPKVLKSGYKPSFDFIMVAPQRNSYSLDPKQLNQVVNEAIRLYPNVDKSRIYLTGLSAGGWGCFGSQLNISTTLAKRFAAIVINSGATQDANKNNFAWWKESKTPLWAVVGASDASYVTQNKTMVTAINGQVPGLAELTTRSGYGHGGWDDVYSGKVRNSKGKTMWEFLYQYTRADDGSSDGITPVPETPTTPPASTSGTVKVNLFGGSNAYSNTEWNNWNTYNGAASLKFTTGAASGITAKLSAQTGVSDSKQALTGTMAPVNVMQYASYSTGTRTLTLTGLNDSKTYSFTFYAGRSGATSNYTVFNINGVSKTVLTDNNNSRPVSFTNLRSSGGTITVTISKTKQYNYLSGFTISVG